MKKVLTLLLIILMQFSNLPVHIVSAQEIEEGTVIESSDPSEEEIVQDVTMEKDPEEGDQDPDEFSYVEEDASVEDVTPEDDSEINEDIQDNDVQPVSDEEETQTDVAIDDFTFVSEDAISALNLQGAFSMDPVMVMEAMEENTDLDEDEIQDIVDTLFSEEEGSDEEEELPSALDGTQIDTMSIKWVTADTVDNEDDSLLYLRPSGNETTSARLQINYSLSGEHNYEPGDIKIIIPAKMFKDRDGRDIGSVTIPYPEDPSTKGDFNWKLVGDEYILTNTKKMSAATKGYFQIEIGDLIPNRIQDMAVSDPYSARMEVVTWKGNLIGKKTEEITAQLDTQAKIDHVNKGVSSKGRVLASQIPEQYRELYPEETEFVVVDWYVNVFVNANTKYTLDLNDSIAEVDQDFERIIIGSQLLDTHDYSYTSSPVLGNGNITSSTYRIRTAYPSSQFEKDHTYTFHNNVSATVKEFDPEIEGNPNVQPVDPQLVTSASASAQTPFLFRDPIFYHPDGHFFVHKNGNDDKTKNNITHSGYSSRYDQHLHTSGYYGIYPSALNVVKDGEDVQLSYTIDTIGYLMPWTFEGDASSQSELMKLSNYFKHYLTLTTTDTGVRLGSDSELLKVKDDYIFKSVEILDPIVYSGEPRNINVEDGTFIVLSADDGTYEYRVDNDMTHYPDIELQIYRNGEWEEYARVTYQSGSREVRYKDGKTGSETVINVPEDTETFRTIVTSNVAAFTYDVRPVVVLKNTERLKEIVDALFEEANNPSYSVCNYSNLLVEVVDGDPLTEINGAGYDSLRGYTTDVAAEPSKSARQVMVDYDDDRVKIRYEASVKEKSLIPELDLYRDAVNSGRLPHETHGTWYDLLPKGVVPIVSTIRLRSGDSITDTYTVENYKGSGRTLLVVEADLKVVPESYRSYDSNYYMDRPYITFDAWYSFEAMKDYGSNIHNVIAFESGNEFIGTIKDMTGEPDDPTIDPYNNRSTPYAFESNDEKRWMTDLDPERDDPSFVYAGAPLRIDILYKARTSLQKEVDVNNEGVYSTGVYYDHEEENKRDVYEGGQYNYRLRMMSDTDTISTDMVLYDFLEDFHAAGEDHDPIDFNAPRWRGYLRAVDISQLQAKGCAPVVYYSTKTGMDLERDEDFEDVKDLNNTEIWTRADLYEGSLDDVRAVAIDASMAADGTRFMLMPEESISAIIRMQAPSGEEAREYIGNNAHAYNNAYLIAVSIDAVTGAESEEDTVRKDYTKVGMIEHNYQVEKTWNDDDDRDGLRGGEVMFTLLANGKDTGKTITVDKDSNWKGVFEHIPYTDENGKKIRYSVREQEMEGYTASYETKEGNIVHVTNSHEAYKMTIDGTKTWIDEKPEESRPDQITLNLYGNEKLVKTIVVKPDKDGNWFYSFDDLYVNENGKPIEYRIEEVLSNGKIVSYSPEYDEDYNIKNIHHPYGDLYVDKSLVDATDKAKEKKFTFLFSFVKDDTPIFTEYDYEIIDEASGEVVSSGKVSGEEGHNRISITEDQRIHVKEIDEYVRYTVSEESEAGFSLTSSSNTSGQIIPNKDAEASFTNTYTTKGQYSPVVTKTLRNRELQKYQFAFELYDEDDRTLLKVATSDKPDGLNTDEEGRYSQADATFGVIRYSNADAGKTFTYWIHERLVTKAGYTYDETVYKLEVSVIDNGDGTLTTVPVYYMADDAVDTAVFKNVYKANGEIVLRVWKELKAGKLEADQFEFEVLNENGEPVLNEEGEPIKAKNDSEGTVAFEAIKYDETDIDKQYIYRIQEIRPEEESEEDPVIYDDSRKEYTVTVTDNGDGTLSTETLIRNYELNEEGVYVQVGKDNDVPVFVNDMKPGKLTVSKYITNPEDADSDQEFTFRVKLIGEDIEDGKIEYHITEADPITENTGDDMEENEETSNDNNGLFSWNILPSFFHKVYAEEGDIATGTSGTCSWRIDQDGVLTIYPTDGESGTLSSNEYWFRTPWSEYHDQVTKLVIEPGVKTGSSAKNALSYLINCSEIVGLENLDTSATTSFEGLFYLNNGLTSLDLSVLDFSRATNMKDMISSCSSLSEVKVSENFIAANARISDVNQRCLLQENGCGWVRDGESSEPLTSHELRYSWGSHSAGTYRIRPGHQGLTGSCVWTLNNDGELIIRPVDGVSGTLPDFTHMTGGSSGDRRSVPWYPYVSSIKKAVIKNGVKASEYANGLFYNCSNLVSVDLSGLDTSTTKNFSGVFNNCSSLEYLDISTLDTGNISTYKFNNAPSVNGGAVIRINLMDGCTSLKKVKLGSNFKFADGLLVTPSGQAYTGKWVREDLSYGPYTPEQLRTNYSSEKAGIWVWELTPCAVVADDGTMYFVRPVATDDYTSGSYGTVHSISGGEFTGTIYAINESSTSSVKTWDKSTAESVSSAVFVDEIRPLTVKELFRYFSNCTSISDIEKLDTSQANSMNYMFTGCSNLESLDISNFDTSNVNNMDGMFYGCSKLTSLDFSNFNTEKVTTFTQMFYECSNLKTLDLSSFRTPRLTSMSQMFANCGVQTLDMSNFDTSNVTSFNSTFSRNYARSIAIGPDFKFKGNSIAGTNNQCTFPSPNSSGYTGKWILVDYSGESFYPTGLRDSYDGATMSGIWVWEEPNTTVRYHSENSAGSMPIQHIKYGEDTALKKNAFVRRAYEFDHWSGDNGKNYSDEEVITAGSLGTLGTLNLTAVWHELDMSADLKDGEFEFTLYGGEKAIFDDIPAGTSYQVYELTPDGWILVDQSDVSGTIEALQSSDAKFFNKYEPGVTSVQFSGTKLLDGVPADKDAFEFGLYEGDELVEKVKTLDGGFFQFSVITYDQEGTHNYTIRELGSSEEIRYDDHIEEITVVITLDEDGQLSNTVIYDEDGVSFRNFTNPGSLRISKETDIATDANKNDEFKIKISFTNDKGIPLSADEDIYWYIEEENEQGSQDDNTSYVSPSFGLFHKVYAEDGDIASGTNWRITASGELIVGRAGETTSILNDSGMTTGMPWYAYASSIRSARFIGTVKAGWRINSLFDYCSNLETVDLTNLDISGCSTILCMFRNCKSLKQVDLSGLNMSRVNSMRLLLNGCSSLGKIKLGSNFVFIGSAQEKSEMIPGNLGIYTDAWIREDGLGPYTASQLANNYTSDMAGTWIHQLKPCAVLDDEGTMRFIRPVQGSEYVSGSRGTIQSVNGGEYTGRIFPVDELSSVNDNRTWNSVSSEVKKVVFVDEISPVSTGRWFDRFYECTEMDLAKLKTDNVTNMYCMFYDCTKLESIDVSHFNTSNVTNMDGVFDHCSGLKELDVSNFDTSKATQMWAMFAGLNVAELDLSNFDTSKVGSMAYMFSSANIGKLDISSFDTARCDLNDIFSNATIRSLVLGEKFDPKGKKSNARNTIPRIPTNSASTGKWIRKDRAYGPYDDAELKNNYSPEMAGTWVWELHACSVLSEDGTMYFIRPEWDESYTNGETKTIRSVSGGAYTGIVYPVNEATDVSYMLWHNPNAQEKTKKVIVVDEIKPQNLRSWFSGFTNVTEMDLTNLNTVDAGKYLERMFENTSKLAMVTLGTKFSFKGKEGTSSSYYTSLATPPSSITTGKWIEVSEAFGPYTPNELRDNYGPDMAGIWVWQYGDNKARVLFDGNGGYVMVDGFTFDSVDHEVTLPSVKQTKRNGYILSGWNTKADGSGTSYDPGETVDDILELNKVVVLYAQWEQSDLRSYTVNHRRESLSGSGYQLYETEFLLGEKDATVEPDVKDYEGYTVPEKKSAVVKDDGSLVIDYYYDLVSYTIHYDGNGATGGTMSDENDIRGIESHTLKSNRFVKSKALFTGWNTEADGSGKSYTDGQKVKDLTREDGGTVVLYAQWLENTNPPLEPQAGEIIVTLKKGQTVVIPELPAGTNYKIEEVELPQGWSLDHIEGPEGTIEANEVASAKVSNNYSAEGFAYIVAHKLLEGEDLSSDKFEFVLERRNSNGWLPVSTVRNGDVDTADKVTNEDGSQSDNPWKGTGIVEFDAVYFTEADIGKEIEFRIRETGDDPIYHYDGHEEIVKVKVSDLGHGQLSTEVIYDEDGPKFTNSVKPGDLEVRKVLVDAPADTDKEFSFTLTLKDADGNELKGEYRTVKGETEGNISSSGTFTLKGGETLTVKDVPEGTIYSVAEIPDPDWTPRSVNDQGMIKAGETVTATIYNTYKVIEPEGDVALKAYKKVIGGVLEEEDDFGFELLDHDGNVIQKKSVDEVGSDSSSITFDAIHFDKEVFDSKDYDDESHTGKTFRYYIREADGDRSDVAYDDITYQADVKLVDNGTREFDITVTYLVNGENVELDESEVVFTNQKKHNLKVMKVSKETKEPLIRAYFAILKDGSFVQEDGSLSDQEYLFRTGSDGTFTAYDLLPGEYVLSERRAPEGYKKADDVQFEIVNEDVEITVEDEAGAVLPKVGGPGDHLYHLTGLCLMLIAGELLFRERRRFQ